MDIKIIKGNYEHIKDCEEAITKSLLGRYYFEKEGSAHRAIQEALEHGTLYVAMEQDVCTGFMYYVEDGAFHSYPYLHLIAVKEEYRGKGIGKQLIEYFEKIAGRDKCFLVVADFNPEAKHFYERMGYRQVGEIPDLYRKGIAERLMMKDNIETE